MLSNDHIAILKAHIHRESEVWVKEYIQNRKAVLERRRTKATGQLIASMEYALTQVASGAVTNVIELAFEEYGRYVDMKKLKPAGGGTEYIAALAQWIVDKGLYEKMVQQYIETRKLRKPPANVLQNLAWAMAKKRAERTPKRTKWYAASSTGAVSDLFNRVAAGLPDIIITELKKGFE